MAASTVGGIFYGYDLWTEGRGFLRAPRQDTVGMVVILVAFASTCLPLWLVCYAFLARKYEVAVEMAALGLATCTFVGVVYVEQCLDLMTQVERLSKSHQSVRGAGAWQGIELMVTVIPPLTLLLVPLAAAGMAYYFSRKIGRWALVSPLRAFDSHGI